MSDQPTPPPGLSAAKLRAWKRAQKIAANSANRMKLVTGQTKELQPAKPDVPEASPSLANEDAILESALEEAMSGDGVGSQRVQGDSTVTNEAGVTDEKVSSSCASDGNRDGGADVAGEGGEATDGEATQRQTSDSAPQTQDTIDGNDNTTQSNPEPYKSKWEKRWESATAANASSERVEEILSKLNEPVVVENTEPFTRANTLKQRGGKGGNATSDNPVTKEATANERASAKGEFRTRLQVQRVRLVVEIIHVLMVTVLALYSGLNWGLTLQFEECMPTLSDSASEAERIAFVAKHGEDAIGNDDDTAYQVGMRYSIPVPLAADSLVVTIFLLNVLEKAIGVGLLTLKYGSTQGYFNSEGGMFHSLVSAVLPARLMMMVNVLRELVKTWGNMFDDLVVFGFVYILSAAVASQLDVVGLVPVVGGEEEL